MVIKATVSGPTPPKVLQAIGVIAAYCREGNFAQCIVMSEGGAAFRLTDIYDEIFGSNIVSEIREAQHRVEPTAPAAKRNSRKSTGAVSSKRRGGSR